MQILGQDSAQINSGGNITVRSDRIQVWIIKRRLSTHRYGKAVKWADPSLLNENGPLKPDRSIYNKNKTNY
jgi:hypothetical protein